MLATVTAMQKRWEEDESEINTKGSILLAMNLGAEDAGESAPAKAPAPRSPRRRAANNKDSRGDKAVVSVTESTSYPADKALLAVLAMANGGTDGRSLLASQSTSSVAPTVFSRCIVIHHRRSDHDDDRDSRSFGDRRGLAFAVELG